MKSSGNAPSRLDGHSRLHLVPQDEGLSVAQLDAELVAGVKAGDVAHATEFHDRLRPQVSRTILRLLHTRTEHDDLVQQALIELVFSVDRFRGQCSLETWAATVTAHVVFKYLRRQKRERRVFSSLDEFGEPLPSSSSPHARDDAAHRSTLRRVGHHLEQMNEDRATVFVLHDVHGYDLREVADIVGISVSNAQTRLVRGRKELHERIRNDAALADVMQQRGSP